MSEDESPLHKRMEFTGPDGVIVTMEYGQALGLTRLVHAEAEQMTGRHMFQINSVVGEDGVNRAVAWRWADEEETGEWHPLPFATISELRGEEE